MPSREELNLRARMCNIDASTITNDSVLEEAVILAERTAAAAAGTGTILAVSNAQTKNDAAAVS